MRTKSQGFTLIELVAVIIILAALSAIATPLFIDLRKDARVAMLMALKGMTGSSANGVRAKAIIDGVVGAASATIVNNGQTVLVTYGWPDPDYLNMVKIVDPIGFTIGWGNGSAAAFNANFPATIFTFWLNSNCEMRYEWRPGIDPEPTYTVLSTGC